MTRVPILLSVPHAGERVPPEAQPYCRLSREEILEDGDEGAAEIYAVESEVQYFVTTDVARAIVDLNRAPDDRRPDGVVKTHTCWGVPIYDPFPPEDVITTLLQRYYHPYHRRLSELAGTGAWLGVDGHTMAATGPPVGPDAGKERPWVCLSNGEGTCPEAWIQELAEAFRSLLSGPVTINDPFRGGYITRSHAREMPWIQVEFSRAPFASNVEKRALFVEALCRWLPRIMRAGA